MLHIIVLLLKFIGIVLLTIIGLIVTLLLVILLVPIRYRVWVTHGALFRLEGRVSWILHIIDARVKQEGELRRIRLRLFGILLYDSARPRKAKKLKRGRRKVARSEEQYDEEVIAPPGSSHSKTAKTRKRDSDGKAIPRGQGASRKQETHRGQEIPTKQDAHMEQEPSGELKQYGKQNSKVDLTNKTGDLPVNETIVPDKLDTGSAELRAEPNKETIKKTKKELNSEPGAELEEGEFVADGPGADADLDSKLNIFSKLSNRIKRIFQGIRNKFISLRSSIKRGWKAFVNIKNKIGLIKDFLGNEENRSAFGVTYGSLKKLLKHVLPRKLRSKVIFGTGDPCSTGQALGAASILYGMYGDHVQITPDFENKVFEGSHYAKGRIRIGTLLIIVIKLLLDKKFKQLKRNFKILKEAL